jgi:hypothetical protein
MACGFAAACGFGFLASLRRVRRAAFLWLFDQLI